MTKTCKCKLIIWYSYKIKLAYQFINLSILDIVHNDNDCNNLLPVRTKMYRQVIQKGKVVFIKNHRTLWTEGPQLLTTQSSGSGTQNLMYLNDTIILCPTIQLYYYLLEYGHHTIERYSLVKQTKGYPFVSMDRIVCARILNITFMDNFKFIKIILLPPNKTCVLQAMDQDVIQNLKKQLIMKIIRCPLNNQLFEFTDQN